MTLIWLFFYGFGGFDGLLERSNAVIYSVILLGVFPTVLATIVYFSVIRLAGAAFLSQINYLIPLWAVMLGVWFGDELLSWNSFVALVVILCGIAIAQRGSKLA